MGAFLMSAKKMGVVALVGGPDRSKGLVTQAGGKPQQRFADVLPFLVGEAAKSGKMAADGAVTADWRNSGPTPVNVPTPKQPFPHANKANPMFSLRPRVSDTRVEAKTVKEGELGRTDKKGQQVAVKPANAGPLVVVSPAVTPSEPPVVRVRPAEAPLPAGQARAAAPPRVPGDGRSVAEAPAAVKQRPAVIESQPAPTKAAMNVEHRTVAASEIARPARPNRAATASVEVSTKQAQVQVPKAQQDEGASEAPRKPPANAPGSGPLTATAHYRREPPSPRVSASESGNAGLNTMVVTNPASKGHGIAAENGLARAPEKPQIAREETGTEVLGRLPSKPDSSRPDTRQNLAGGHDVNRPSRSVKEETAQPAVKGAPALRPQKEELDVRPEVPTVAAGEPALSQYSVTVSPGRGSGTMIRSPIQDVGEQILDSMRASLARGDHQLQIRLHPPELGTVVVWFHEESGHVSGLLEVSKSDTQREIERALPEVLRSLQEAGVEVRKLDVVTSEQSQREFGKGQPQQDAWPQQHGAGQEREYPQTPSQARWLRPGTGYLIDAQEEPTMDLPMNTVPGGIDMLL